MLSIIRRINGRFLFVVSVVSLPLTVFGRWLTSTLTGMFIFSVAAYALAQHLGMRVLSPGELILWFAELDVELQAGVVSALITVLGFFIAFTSANRAWKTQTLSTLQAQAAGEIRLFFEQVQDLLNDTEFYAEKLVDEVSRIRLSNENPCYAPMLKLLIEDGRKFRDSRDRLVKLGVSVYTLNIKFNHLLAPIGGAVRALADCESALSTATQSIWAKLPVPPNGHPEPERYFVKEIDLEEWKRLAQANAASFDRLSGLSSMLSAALMRPFLTMNFWSSMHSLELLRNADSALESIRPGGKA